MNITIEHIFCPYCDEVINLYFIIMNTILFSCNEAELRTSMERLKKKTRFDEYFTYGFGAHHLWICPRKPSDKNKVFEHRIMIARFFPCFKSIGKDGLHFLDYSRSYSQYGVLRICTFDTFYHGYFPGAGIPFLFSFGCTTPFYSTFHSLRSDPHAFARRGGVFLPAFLPASCFPLQPEQTPAGCFTQSRLSNFRS